MSFTIPGTYNFRDLGGLPSAGTTTRHGVFLRSDALTGLGDDGFEALLELGVRTAVDLREDKERDIDPPTLAEGVAIHHRPIFARAFSLDEGDTLAEVYAKIVEHCGDRIAGVVALLAEPEALPAVIFCSAGKDRTGLVCALTLSAVGVPDDVVAEEYARTEQAMHGEFRDVLIRRSRDAGYDVQDFAIRAASPASLMLETLSGIRARHGDAAAYLLDHGLEPQTLDALRHRLLA